jgi:hypothetical protein
MKNSEEAIDRVLAGLRDADPPAGMERRILDRLKERETERSRSEWRPIWLVTPVSWAVGRPVACGVALAGVLAVVWTITVVRRPGHVPVQSRVSVAPVESVHANNSEAIEKSAQVSRREPRVRSVGKMNVRKVSSGAGAGVNEDSDSLALQEFRAASQPAPPLPLTEQEKLLLRIAHRGAPEELAALNPSLRAERDAEEKAEVQRFFEPKKTTADNE